MQPEMQLWLGTDGAEAGPLGHLAKSRSVPAPDAVPMVTDTDQRKQAKQRYHQRAQKQYRCAATQPQVPHCTSLKPGLEGSHVVSGSGCVSCMCRSTTTLAHTHTAAASLLVLL